MADITSDKIRQLLSDPKNIELIAGIAGSMGGNGGLLGALSGSDQKENDTGCLAVFPACWRSQRPEHFFLLHCRKGCFGG